MAQCVMPCLTVRSRLILWMCLEKLALCAELFDAQLDYITRLEENRIRLLADADAGR